MSLLRADLYFGWLFIYSCISFDTGKSWSILIEGAPLTSKQWAFPFLSIKMSNPKIWNDLGSFLFSPNYLVFPYLTILSNNTQCTPINFIILIFTLFTKSLPYCFSNCLNAIEANLFDPVSQNISPDYIYSLLYLLSD